MKLIYNIKKLIDLKKVNKILIESLIILQF